MIGLSLRGNIILHGSKVAYLESGETTWSVNTRENIFKKIYMTDEEFNNKTSNEQFQWLMIFFKKLKFYHQ